MTYPWEEDTLPASLCRLASKNGMWEKDVARFPDILETANLKQEDMTDEIVEEAATLGRFWSRHLHRLVAEFNEKEKLKLPAVDVQPPETQGGNPRPFGFSSTAILRWMGEERLSEWDALRFFKFLNIKLADRTIKAQLRAGRNMTGGEPAKLTKRQSEEVYSILKETLK